MENSLGCINLNLGKFGKGSRGETSHTGGMGVQEISQEQIPGNGGGTEIKSPPTFKVNLDSERRL
jgi:hypothetical protein